MDVWVGGAFKFSTATVDFCLFQLQNHFSQWTCPRRYCVGPIWAKRVACVGTAQVGPKKMHGLSNFLHTGAVQHGIEKAKMARMAPYNPH